MAGSRLTNEFLEAEYVQAMTMVIGSSRKLGPPQLRKTKQRFQMNVSLSIVDENL